MFFGVFSYVMGVLYLEDLAGVLNLRYWKKEENEKTDILFLGGSSISCNIEIGELWKEYGIACYCLGGGGSTFCDDYYRLIEGEKHHQSDRIVVEMKGASMDDAQIDLYRNPNVSGINMSWNKLHYINATIKPEQKIYYLLTFPLHHRRYNSVTKWDFKHTSSLGEDDKGTWTVFYGSVNTLVLDSAKDMIEYKVLDQQEEYYLRKIIEYCDTNGKDLLLLKTPDGNRKGNQPFYNTVELIAETYGVPFLDLNLFDREIGLTNADFYTDNFHLNVEGARKCTNFFGNYLKENYDLTDHRGEDGYDSWERFAANREDLYMRAITDNTDYFDELVRDKRKIVAVSCGLSQEKSEQYLKVKDKLGSCEYELYDTEDVLYGEEYKDSLTLGDNRLTIQKDYGVCSITVNGKTDLSIPLPGMILIVYDDVTGQIADISAFTRANGFKVQHFYTGGND